LRDVFLRERDPLARAERPDDRFLAVRRRAFRFGAFAFLPRAELFRDLARFFGGFDAGRFALGAAGGVGV
jgi:hypothetical protein